MFAAVYCAGECLCVLACLLLWLASPVPHWRDGDSWRARHVQVLSWYLGMLMHTAEQMIAFRLTLECHTWVNIDAWIQEQGDMAGVTQQREPRTPRSQPGHA